MALLDFMKNRNNQQQDVAQKPQEQTPVTAKQLYTRQDAQERASQKPVDQLPPAQQQKLDEVKARLEKATQHVGNDTPPSPPNAGGSASPQALRQNMSGQDKAAPALSPTSEHAGATAKEQSATKQSESPSKATDSQTQTIARRPPSWER